MINLRQGEGGRRDSNRTWCTHIGEGGTATERDVPISGKVGQQQNVVYPYRGRWDSNRTWCTHIGEGGTATERGVPISGKVGQQQNVVYPYRGRWDSNRTWCTHIGEGGTATERGVPISGKAGQQQGLMHWAGKWGAMITFHGVGGGVARFDIPTSSWCVGGG